MSTDKQSIRALRNGARANMIEAVKFLGGQPGMTPEQQMDALSHAKQALLRALMDLEIASHTVLIRTATQASEAMVAQESFEGIQALEEMLSAVAAQPTDTSNTSDDEGEPS